MYAGINLNMLAKGPQALIRLSIVCRVINCN